MAWRSGAAALLALLALSAGGCVGVGSGDIPETKYFVIDYALKRAKSPKRVLPVTVGVDKFRSDAIYRTDKIIYRKVPYRVDFYPYERWGARPEDIVADRLLDHIQASGRVREVVRATGGVPMDYLVRGRVKRFEEISNEGKFMALARIELSVIHRNTGDVVLQRQFSGTSPAKTKPPRGFVNAMADNLKKLLGEAADEIADVITKHRAKKGRRP